MQPASFTIEAIDYTGARQQQGGDAFFVAIRCNAQGTRARAKITDNNDGSYTIVHKPPSAGKYTIAISLLGEPLPGSPFTCVVTTPTPKAENCLLQGDALTKATARKHEYFRISFRVSTNAPFFWLMHMPTYGPPPDRRDPMQAAAAEQLLCGCGAAAAWRLRGCCVAAAPSFALSTPQRLMHSCSSPHRTGRARACGSCRGARCLRREGCGTGLARCKVGSRRRVWR